MIDQDKTCRTCRWYASFEGVCCNGDSEHRADFTDPDDTCREWGRGKPMKAYIAGKITGDSDYWHKFSQAQEDLENEGFTVINPAELPEGMEPADYMRICFAMMDSADIVAFLSDYRQSRGAQLEHAWCQYVGKQTMYLECMSFYRA